MRSHKFLIVSATMLATTALSGVSFADNTPTGMPGSMSDTAPSTGAPSVITPSSPSSTTSATTQQGTTGYGNTTSAGTVPPASSMTTTTSAEDMSAAAPMPSPTSAAPPTGETTTAYQRRRPNRPILITGGALLLGTYVTTAALVGANGPVADHDLYIPVVGPWINLADRSTDRGNNTRDTVLIAGSGVLQGVGAAMLITSFFVPESMPSARISAGNVKMQVTPTASYNAAGVGAIGTF